MTALIRYETARAALAEARSVDEVKGIYDRAEAMRAYGRIANDVQLELDAAEIRVRAERRLGILIAQQKNTVGLNKGQLRRGTRTEPRENVPTLADAGIDKKLSSRSQKVAEVAEEEFEGLISELRTRLAESRRHASLDIVRERAKTVVRQQHEELVKGGGTVHDLAALAASGYRAATIMADPPWHFMTRSPKGEGRSASQHYNTNPIDEIKALPIANLAARDAVLLIWMVDWAPQAALDVIAAWGFEHKTTAFTWVKQNRSEYGMFMGQGYWTRANPESCWLATRGSPSRLNADVRQLIIARIEEHSRKPDEVYSRVERLVAGPYLELYARRQRPGWTTWGNEIPAPAIVQPLPQIAELPPHDPDTGEILEEEELQPEEIEPEFDEERDMPAFLRRTPEKTE